MNIHERDSLGSWWRPGTLSPAIVWAVGLACALSVTVAAVAGYALVQYLKPFLERSSSLRWNDVSADAYRWPIDPYILAYGVAGALAVAIAAALLPRWRLSRWLRVAVLLPAIHLVACGVVWLLWRAVVTRFPVDSTQLYRLAESLPLTWVALLLAMIAATAGVSCSRRRRREWLHATVMTALVNLLLLGLWLPLASWWWCRGINWAAYRDADYHALERALGSAPEQLIAFVMWPPILVSIAFTVLAFRAPESLRKNRRVLAALLGVLIVAACAVRFDPSFGAARIYINFLHVLLAGAVVVICALVALGASIWIRARRARKLLARDPLRRHGVVVVDGETPMIGCHQITSWLRGPRSLLGSFTLASSVGDLHVPAGAELVAHVPPVTTRLAIGDAIEIVRAGEHVVVGGFVEPPEGHPFRDSVGLIPGPHGVLVQPLRDPGTGFGDAALALWRPCVAYFAILAAVAIPALVAAFTIRTRI